MVDIRPFRGVRFNPRHVPDLAQVVCPPYDVISPSEQADLYARSPHNLVRLELGRDEPGDDEQRNRYTRAAATLDEWVCQGVLVVEPQPALYLHHERFRVGDQTYQRRDLIARLRLAEWAEGQVLPHERTMDQPKADRLRLLQETATQLSPVWALYQGPSPALEQAWAEAERQPPVQAFTDHEGRHHRLWAVTDEAMLTAVADDFRDRRLYIADGHHRYETALHYRRQRREAAGSIDPTAPYEFVMALVTSASDPGLVVLPTHRLVHGGAIPSTHTIEQALAAHFALDRKALPADEVAATRVIQGVMDRAAGAHVFALYVAGVDQLMLLSLRESVDLAAVLSQSASPAWRELDVVILHRLVIKPLFEAHGARLSYTRDAAEAVHAIRGGQAQAALFLRATPVSQVLAVADAGERMPEKSTFFYPKPPTGLVLYQLQ